MGGHGKQGLWWHKYYCIFVLVIQTWAQNETVLFNTIAYKTHLYHKSMKVYTKNIAK